MVATKKSQAKRSAAKKTSVKKFGRRDVEPVRCRARQHDNAVNPGVVGGVEERGNAANETIADGVVLDESKSQADIHRVPRARQSLSAGG
jgi:hypothetical protein